MYICSQILMWPLEKGQIAKSAALLWHSCFFQKPGDVTLSFSPVDYFRKTSLSFGFSLERKHQITEAKVSRSISKLLVVAKEIVKTRLLKS